MASVTQPKDRPTIRLSHVDFAGVEFNLLDENGGTLRAVRVNVASGASWSKAVRFPEVHSAATASTGDESLDREIRDRAAEELARLEGATTALRAAA